MGILDSVWEGLTGFVGDIPEGLLGLGANIYNNYDQGQRRDDLVNAYKQREQANYDKSKAEHDYWQNQYLPQYQAYQAANSAAAASRSAAARATEQNRRKAAKKGMKVEKKYFNEAMGNLNPYIETGHRMLPQVEKTYGNALSGLQMMQGYMNTPEYAARMNQSVPATQTNIPLPDWIKGNK